MDERYRVGVCLNCRRPSRSLVGRGLCITCHRRPAVRAAYPPRDRPLSAYHCNPKGVRLA